MVKGHPVAMLLTGAATMDGLFLLNQGFPCKVSIETARKWLHKLGFAVLTPKKGLFIDDHERPDVVT